jgi:P-type Cu2+ transporter
MAESDLRCYHCDEQLYAQGTMHAELAGIERGFCCAGCMAAAQWLHGGGLGDFYRLRSESSARVDEVDSYSAWDSAAFHGLYVRRTQPAVPSPAQCEVDVSLDGLRCAACAWLIPRIGETIAGVHAIDLNAATGRARLRWNPQAIKLSAIVGRLAQLGYRARVAEQGKDRQRAERRTALKRIALAGIAAMQAMMMSEALYFGGNALDPGTRDFLRWMTLLLSTPVVLWAAAPFFRGAALEWKLRRWGMDTLVALSVGLAYSVSVIETLRGGPEVYFDAAVMFVFFLLLARYIEAITRERARAAIARIQSLPTTVRKYTPAGWVEVSLLEIAIGDCLQVQAGHDVPADGVLDCDSAELDESLLTGEARAQRRLRGDRVLAGSIALGAPLRLRVEQLGSMTWLAQLSRLVDQAQHVRPAIQSRAETWARIFVVMMIALALGAAMVWMTIDSDRALPVALAVLAAACPCAFALAIPAAQAAAQAELARRGVLVVHPDALERAAGIDRVAFDKTGTLTLGRPSIDNVERFGAAPAEAGLIEIAAALERGHRHPIAHAFRAHDRGHEVTSAQVHAGDGVSGIVAGISYRLGRRRFVDALAAEDDGRVWLARSGQHLAAFTLCDALRDDAPECIARLHGVGIDSLVLSGDSSHSVRGIADALGLRRARGDLRPDQKLSVLQAEQRSGHRVAMIGDGINDAPVLAAADLAIAMGEGAALAQRSADAILLRPALELVPHLLAVARRTQRIVRQNLVWSVGYHLVMLPAALIGVMPPWLAALGMSLSSLLVTLNAARLLSTKRLSKAAPQPGARPVAALP